MTIEKQMEQMQDQIKSMHTRVFNGLGKEIRDEVKKDIDGLRNLVVGILTSLLLALLAFFITNQVNSGRRSEENNRNYEAILNVEKKLDIHLQTTIGGPP